LWILTASVYNYNRKHKKGSVELPTFLFGYTKNLSSAPEVAHSDILSSTDSPQ
jgi:hypothetical protein